MKQKSIYKCGALCTFDRLEDSQGMRVSRDLAEKFSAAFARLSCRYFNSTGDLPYTYRERQVSASVLMAFSTFVDAIFAETPTRRGTSKANSHGWIDYWVVYRNHTFLVEVKHCYSAIKGQKDVQAVLFNRWENAHSQLSQVNYIQCADLRFGTGALIKMPLMIATHYLSSRKKEKAEIGISIDQLCNRHVKISDNLSPMPGWSSIFIVKDKMRGPYEYKEHWEAYPAVSFFADFNIS